MGCLCGSQVILCNLPIRFDTYKGCTHACRYCFAQKKQDISKIRKENTAESLKNFIEGKRNDTTAWCDWNIPIHWGGMSDPFQPIERKYKVSYECLKVLAQTKYPFVVSTKGRLVATDEYVDLLAQCNCVVQISMVCSRYDKLEKGCPTYEERLEMARKLAARVQRVIIRIQPYMPEVFKDVMNNIPRLAEAGVYGVVVEGMKFFKSKPGMVKIGGGPLLSSPYTPQRFRGDKSRVPPKRNEVLFWGEPPPHYGRRYVLLRNRRVTRLQRERLQPMYAIERKEPATDGNYEKGRNRQVLFCAESISGKQPETLKAIVLRTYAGRIINETRISQKGVRA